MQVFLTLYPSYKVEHRTVSKTIFLNFETNLIITFFWISLSLSKNIQFLATLSEILKQVQTTFTTEIKKLLVLDVE